MRGSSEMPGGGEDGGGGVSEEVWDGSGVNTVSVDGSGFVPEELTTILGRVFGICSLDPEGVPAQPDAKITPATAKENRR
jgi:hypothetical protein